MMLSNVLVYLRPGETSSSTQNKKRLELDLKSNRKKVGTFYGHNSNGECLNICNYSAYKEASSDSSKKKELANCK